MDGSTFDCSVVLAAEHDIKRLTVAVDWNLMQHVQSLFEFFLGTAKTMKQQVDRLSLGFMGRHGTICRSRTRMPYGIHRIFDYD